MHRAPQVFALGLPADGRFRVCPATTILTARRQLSWPVRSGVSGMGSPLSEEEGMSSFSPFFVYKSS